MEILSKLLGIEQDENGLYLFKKNIIPPWVAMTFQGPKANGKSRHVGLVKADSLCRVMNGKQNKIKRISKRSNSQQNL